MTEVVSIRFNCHGKAYYFAPNGIDVKPGDKGIVETATGLDLGECCYGPHMVDDESIIPPLRPVIRIATEEDLQIAAKNKEREKEAFEICKEKIAARGLDMKLVGVECGFEGNKILFFFTADGRVDFRELVKDLAAVFRTRIELRQIGVRDETKMLGGLGICGRPYCCRQFLNDFQPVSTKMAKTQSMSLNPTKISGSCGRLMCCLRYEQEAYEELLKNIPKTGAYVKTAQGYGSVIQTNVLRQKVKVRMDDEGEDDFRIFDAADVTVVSGGKPKSGEELSAETYLDIPDEEGPSLEELEDEFWEDYPSSSAKNGNPSPAAPEISEDGDIAEDEKTDGADDPSDEGSQEQKREQIDFNSQDSGAIKNRPHSNNSKPVVKPANTQAVKANHQRPRNVVKPYHGGEVSVKNKERQQNTNRNKKHYPNKTKSPNDSQN
ncbi:MAG: stage 0 sporulation family protein [Clostridiales bacterium]|nr:stage 0 sporulation family protein [Clostridiales bacterium]